jgi:hypothetical protein
VLKLRLLLYLLFKAGNEQWNYNNKIMVEIRSYVKEIWKNITMRNGIGSTAYSSKIRVGTTHRNNSL